MQDTLAKKIFAVGSAAAMVAALVVPFAASAAVHSDGTNVSDSTGTVYMVVGGQLRPYTSAGAFLSYGFNSWSTVVPASAEDLALPKGSFIAPQDGKIFCATATKGTDVKGECALVTGGQKASFTSATVFKGLGFSFARAQNGDSSFLSKTANVDNSTAAHLPGVLINKGGTVYLVGTNGLLGIPDLATFNSWGDSFSDVVPANAADNAMSQTGVMATRTAGQLSPVAQVPGVTPPPGVVSGSVSAMLSSDTPAATTVVAGQAIADLAHFAFTGTGTVTQVVLQRIGVSADTTLSNVYLYVGNNKVTDAGSVSNGLVTFSNSAGLFTVNGTVVVSVKSDIASTNGSTSTSGQTVGAQLTSYTVANGTPVAVSVSGNTMTVAAVGDLASVTLNSISSPSSNVNAGTMNTSLWTGSFSVATRKVNLKYVAFKQVGSVPAGSLQNIKLYVAGAPVGTPIASLDASNNVTFDMSANPVVLNTGTQTIELRADIIKGSSFNFSLRLQTTSDIVLVDTNYGVNITCGGSFPASASSATVTQGTVSTQQDATYNVTQIVKNSSNLTLGQWTMKAYGEDMKVMSLKVLVNFKDNVGAATDTIATEGFNNLSVYVNGGMVGSSANAVGLNTHTTVTKSFGSTNLFTIPAGQTVTVAVKGDLALDTTTKVSEVLTNLYEDVGTMQGVTSYQTYPTVAVGAITATGVTLSVVSSSVTLAKNSGFAAQTVSPNSTAQKIGSFVIQSSNADGVRVTSLTVNIAGTLNSSAPTAAMANLYLQAPNGATQKVNPSTANNFSVDFTVAANQSATVDVYADITNSTGTIVPSMYGSGLGVTSGQSVYLSADGSAYNGTSHLAVTGSTVTVNTGSIASNGSQPTLNTGSSPVAQFVVGNQTNQPIATYNFVATGGTANVTELHFTVTGTHDPATDTPVTAVHVGGQTGNVLNSGSAETVTVSGLNVPITVGSAGVDVPVTVDFAAVGTNGVTSGKTIILTLTYVKYLSGSTTTTFTPSVPAPTMTIVASKPVVTAAASGASLVAGSVEAIDVTVTATGAAGDNAAAITLNTLPLVISMTNATASATDPSNIKVYKSTDMSTNLATGNTVLGSTTSGTTTVTLDNTKTRITAGSPVTFKVFVTVTNGNVSGGGAGSASMSTSLGAAASGVAGFSWTDTEGGGSAELGTALITQYPSSFSAVVHN